MPEVPNKIETPVMEVTSELRHTGSKVGLFGNTPAERPGPIVQTYSSKTKTHSNPTGAAVTDNTGESPDTTIEELSIKSSKFWPFASPAGSSGVFYFGGTYQFHSSAFTPAGGTSVGTANSSYAAHAIVVLGAALRSWGAGHLLKNDGLTITGPYAHLRHPREASRGAPRPSL